MPRFSYKAKDIFGKTLKGTLEADNEQKLDDILRERNCYLLYFKEYKSKERKNLSLSLFSKKIKRKDIIFFTNQLATILSSGISLVQGLSDLGSHTEKPHFKKVIEDITRDVQEGSGLSDAMARHTEAFSEVYVSIVRAGEATGRVDLVLYDLVRFLEWQEEIAGAIKQATIYPIAVLTAVLILIIFLFVFFIPRFMKIFESIKVELPLPTRIIIKTSAIFSRYWIFLLIFIIGMVVLIKATGKTEQGGLFLDKMKLKIPALGSLLQKIALSRFSHYMQTLFHAGIDISQALWIVERIVGNKIFSRIIKKARDEIRSGAFLSQTLSKEKVFPNLVIRMIAVGEETGRLEEMLSKVSQYYDQEVQTGVKRFFAIFEPAIIGFLGGIVLFVALSVFLPLFKMMGAIK